MKVMLLPSSVPSAGEPPLQYLIAYLVNDSVAIDAGSLGFYRTPDVQAGIKHVFVSHSHADHTASLPLFVENAYTGGAESVIIHGGEETLASLRSDMFNGRIWPDLVALAPSDAPFLRLNLLEPGRPLAVEGLRITPVAMDHTVPTLGFLLEEAGQSVLIASDTGPTEEVWRVANAADSLRAVFLEAAFPDELAGLAAQTKHLTPSLFGAEVRKLRRPAQIIAVHIKARFHDQVVRELDALRIPGLEIGELGRPYAW